MGQFINRDWSIAVVYMFLILFLVMIKSKNRAGISHTASEYNQQCQADLPV